MTGASPNVDLERTVFDVLVVGSGFGGGTTAYALSRAGLKVLLVERGGWPARDETDWNGRAILLDGRYKGETPVDVRQAGARSDVETFPNEVVGGNSIFFGGAALRLRATDFARWPIAYTDLEAHYGEAEALLEVHGKAGDDPCEPPRSGPYPYPPVELTTPARRIADAARGLGLHPFHIPIAINHAGTREPRCINCFTCDGFPCRIGAKNDVTQTALAKADPNNLAVVARTVAARLVERDGRIEGVEAIDRDGGRRLTLRARVCVLSGGAIGSPALMLRSGLGARDASGTLGRYLMRHCNAMTYGVFLRKPDPRGEHHKQIAVHDWYFGAREAGAPRGKLGNLQQIMGPRASLVAHILPKALGWVARLAEFPASRLTGLLCIAEDQPRAENRVRIDPARPDAWGLPKLIVEHRHTERDLAARAFMVRKAKQILRRAGALAFFTWPVSTFSHAVGTVRMGDDERTAPLDPECRFRGLENLYVTDGSVFPTSAGVNPSLTISANAMRVGQLIVRALTGASAGTASAGGSR